MTRIPGAAFGPHDISIFKDVLDECVALLPPAERTSTTKARIAERILITAAKGERDPVRLRSAALFKVVDKDRD